MIKQFLVFLLVVSSLYTKAQNIATIQLRPKYNQADYAPIIKLGQALQLSFDDLDGDNKEYSYKIEHMTHDWKPSNLSANQYINGFDENEIINASNSFNTLQSYTHYTVDIPNSNTIITKSGNYLISVLDEDYEVVFTRKFVVYEELSTVGVSVLRSRNTATSNTQQTVQFRINHPNLAINYPTQELKTVLIQNNNWNIAINNIEPVFIKPNQLIYSHTVKTNFWGGNEFLNFDTKIMRSTSLEVVKTELKELYNSYLYPDEPRNEKIYTYAPDINGNFVVRTTEGTTTSTEADYTRVHFTLQVFEPYTNKDVYVYGGFNNFEFNENNLMTYNKTKSQYEATMLFKQGFYNYSYAIINNQNKVNLHEVDGSFFQTENQYTAIIYYRPMGGIYDRVIGVGRGYFNQNN